MNGGMKSENLFIIELGIILSAFGFLSFFRVPAFDKGAWFIIGVISTQFANMIGYKFGRSMPQQAGDPKAGQQTQQTDTKVTTSTSPLPVTDLPLQK